MTFIKPSVLASAVFFFTHQAQATTALDTVDQQLADLNEQIELLQKKLSKVTMQSKHLENVERQNSTEAPKPEGIKIGGAVRTNYSYVSYDDDAKDRGGDFDFDIFRLNFSGEVGDVELNAEIRFFDYMTAIKYAYAAYDFSSKWQMQAGITKVPFGNWPYNSHSYFFSTNYYIGLEDDHDLGVVLKRKAVDNWQLDIGFFKNDEQGGIDGYVDNRSDRYSYDVVGFRTLDEGVYAEPIDEIAEYNTLSIRYGYHVEHENGKTEIGFSALSGGLHDGNDRAGDYQSWALHLNSHIGPWNFQLQHGEYDYDIENANRMAVGAYSFYDSIAAQATTTNANIAYSLVVDWGPVTGLQFYNDYGIIYDKSDNSEDTWMNVTGFSVAAGGLFTYFDFVNAKNQPFVGGSIAGDSDDVEQRFNINIGYYF
ncbi:MULTISPECIES: porin [unclassified Pseudoalteromonas]|uniref:porin n=1 Tax=unclassified Pseudoalteromonas TaxID=194690 RepID=UPI0025B616D3|nr:MULTISPECIES: porin [unclassified Pseudoalteromonas]MDN3377281.1 porin [Pseudoalteromonas sp. APC 3893]MDN3385551.1 porin [Pseudoalteromonas sp. APC 4017]